MKYKIHETTQYKREIKKLIRSGLFKRKDKELLDELLYSLANEKAIDTKYKDHELSGYKHETREFHFRPDLLVRYTKINSILVLSLDSIANHNNMFGKGNR